MKKMMRDFPVTMEELRDMVKKEEARRCGLIAVTVSVIAILIGVIIWVARKREKDLEEHYEYFDDDFDELDENYGNFDDSIYDDEKNDKNPEEKIEYVKIHDFMNEKQNKETAAEKAEEKSDQQTKEEASAENTEEDKKENKEENETQKEPADQK